MIPEIILIGVIGGLVTGVSPCILPVLPIVLAVSADAKRKPALVALGIALSFTAITLLGTVALSALGLPGGTLRWIGVVLLVIVGLSMLFPALGHLLERPFAAIRVPEWISSRTRGSAGRGSGFGIGLALGAVYAPCAGPVLAAVTVAGATGNIGWPTVILALSFAFGACVPLFFFALAGSTWSRRTQLAADNRAKISRIAGALVLALALAIATDVPAKLQRTLPDWTASARRSSIPPRARGASWTAS
nr:cytochrome c biogenesis CcdA family protein [Corynebacterium lactis]